jgi:(S)-3,5-dihydroxyphenylglycine transaminase
MAKIKSLLTNNTPALNQAILGGVLLDMNYSLNELNRPKFESYRNKRDQMITSLNRCFRAEAPEWGQRVKWNVPDGGFFIKMVLPFEVEDAEVVECAGGHGVIFSPMRYFHLGEGGRNEIRLSFSNLSMSEIDTGVQRLAGYVKSKVSAIEAGKVSAVEMASNY